MEARLQVLIATHGVDGLARVAAMNRPEVEGVAYLVGCQNEPVDIPEALKRNDITVLFSESQGLSNNRNFLLSAATAKLVLLGDDDLDYYPEGLTSVINAFKKDPTLHVALFQHDGAVYRNRHSHQLRTHSWRTPEVYSCDLALRRDAIVGNQVRFNPLFGKGSPYLKSGEDDIFLHDALESGLVARYIPITISRHKGPSTHEKAPTPGTLRARGAVLRILHPTTSILRILRTANLLQIKHMLDGWRYAAKL